MRKRQNYDDAANALNFVESIEKYREQLESWCEEQVSRCTGDLWVSGFAAERIKPVLLSYIKAAKHLDISTKDNVENLAFRISMAKYAERLANRYGVELN